LFGSDSDHNAVHNTPDFNRFSLQSTYTVLEEPLPTCDALNWHVPFDTSAFWDLPALPNQSELPFFPSSTDHDLFPRPDILPTFSSAISEEHHSFNSSPAADLASTSTDSRSRSRAPETSLKPDIRKEPSARIEKRQANTLAARRYRQKRLDQVAELEAELKEARLERDAFKNQVLKLQGETELLKDLLRQKS